MNMTPAIEVIFGDDTRELELRYADHEIGELDGYPFLRLEMKDTYYPFRVSEYIRVILAEQLYRAWSVLRNHPYHRA